MSRRIDTGPAPLPGANPPLLLGGEQGEDYLGRLVKYVPSEIVGLYLTTAAAVPKRQDQSVNFTALWFVFFLNFILVPIYLYYGTRENGKGPLWPQIVLGSIAFPVWVFAIGGPFQCFIWYQHNTWIASIALAFVTVVIGLYKPQPGS